MKRMFLKKRLCLMMVMILAIVTVFMGKPMTAKAAEQVTVNYDFNEVSDVCINTENNHAFPGDTVDGNATSDFNTIFLYTDPSKHFQTIKINGTDYPVNDSNTTTIPGPGNAQKVTLNNVPASPTYNIEVTTISSGYNSIQWVYDANSPFGRDAYVEHGKVKMVSINGNTDVSSYRLEDNDTGGTYYVQSGAMVTVKLIPDHGYQVYSAVLNDTTNLTPDSSITSQFSFTMPSTNIHFSGKFQASTKGDVVENTATQVVAGGTIGNGAAIAKSGDAKVKLNNAQQNALMPAGATLTTGETKDDSLNIQSVDITTEQIVYQGNTTSYWNDQQTDLSEEAEISLTVNQAATGYAVFRTHGGNVEEIASTYDSATGKLTFGSSKFSTYTLVPLTAPKNNYTIRYPEGSNAGSSTDSHKSSSDAPVHTHNYEWQTITEPTAEQDGLEAYVCTICGSYKESVPVSAYSYACTDAAKKVLTAKQNDTLVLKMGRWHSYPKWFMEKLASRSDLTIKLQFEYQHKQYELTIPAGAKIDTECDWYGPLKLCSLYEYTVK